MRRKVKILSKQTFSLKNTLLENVNILKEPEGKGPEREKVKIMELVAKELSNPERDCKKFDPGHSFKNTISAHIIIRKKGLQSRWSTIGCNVCMTLF